MAVLINNGAGNWTSSTLWSLCDTLNQTSAASTTSTTTSKVYGPNKTVGTGVVIDAVLINVKRLLTTGTFDLILSDGTTDQRTTQINANDLPNSVNQEFVLIKLSSPFTTVGTTLRIGVISSTSASVSVGRSATASDWYFRLRTTTTQAVATSGDTVFVAKEFTGASTSNANVVTYDNVTNTNTVVSLDVCAGGQLTWENSASKAYWLKMSAGIFAIAEGGGVEIGNSTTRLDSTSSAEISWTNAANVDFGMTNHGTLRLFGKLVTPHLLLAADAAAAATSITLSATPTGWKSGDTLAFASTTTTASQAETKALSADVSTTTASVAALTNAHSGTSTGSLNYQGEVANITRNIRIHGTSTSLQAYVTNTNGATVDWDSAEFFNMGSNTSNKRGIEIQTSPTSCSVKNCSFHDYGVANSIGMLVTGNTSVTFDKNVFYLISNTCFNIGACSGTPVITDNLAIRSSAANGFSFGDVGGTITGNRSTSNVTTGFSISEANDFGTFNNNIAHSNNTAGFDFTGIQTGNIDPTTKVGFTSWRNTTFGVNFSVGNTNTDFTFTCYANTTANVEFGTGQNYDTRFVDCSVQAGVTPACPVGWRYNGCTNIRTEHYACLTGTVSTHSTGDIQIVASSVVETCTWWGCTFGSTTTVASQANLFRDSRIGIVQFGGTASDDRVFERRQTQQRDLVNTYSDGGVTYNWWMMTAIAAGGDTVNYEIAINSGQQPTISVDCRKSSNGTFGDIVAYAGSQPTLMLKPCKEVGGTIYDVTLATMTVGNATIETLSGQIPFAATKDGIIRVEIVHNGTAGVLRHARLRVS
jgi:hypothetical protein